MEATGTGRANPWVAAIPMSQRVAVLEAMRGRGDLANLASGNPDMPMPEPVRAAVHRLAEDGYARYCDYDGIPELRAGIAAMLESAWGLAVDPDASLLVTSGVQQGLYTVMRTLLRPGDEVIIPSPHYGTYFQNTVACGATPVTVPLDASEGYRPDFDRLAAAVSPKSRAIVFCNPNNPLGVVWPREILEQTADFAKTRDLVVLVDEIYRDYTYGLAPFSIGALPGMARRTFTFGGFSKSHLMMGLRIGFVAGPPALMTLVKKLHYCVALCPGILAQKAALAALACLPADLAPVRDHYRTQLERLYMRVSALPGVTCVPPRGGFYIFPDFSRHTGDAMAFAVRLIEEAGVVTLPGTEFGQQGQSHLRLSVCAAAAEVETGIARLEAFFGRQSA